MVIVIFHVNLVHVVWMMLFVMVISILVMRKKRRVILLIELYTGTPGSGKSLHMAKDIKQQIQLGRPCIGNFEINYDMIKPHWITKKRGEYIQVDFEDLTPEMLVELSRKTFSSLPRLKEDYILLFIDESQIYFNSREWNAKGRKDWIKFFSLHRHYGYKVILVAQQDKMIDKQIRGFVEHEVVHRKAINFGLWGFIFNMLALGKLHIAVTSQYLTKTKLRSKWFKCRKSLYKLYDTFALFDGQASVQGLGPCSEPDVQTE